MYLSFVLTWHWCQEHPFNVKMTNLQLGQLFLPSVKFRSSNMSNSLWPHGLQHARLLCPSPTPGIYSKVMSIESVMPSNHLILCHLLPLPSIFPSISSNEFCSESVLCIRWPKYWSFSFSISPSSDYSGLISFRMDWLDLLAIQGTLKSLLQLHSSTLRYLIIYEDHKYSLSCFLFSQQL